MYTIIDGLYAVCLEGGVECIPGGYYTMYGAWSVSLFLRDEVTTPCTLETKIPTLLFTNVALLAADFE